MKQLSLKKYGLTKVLFKKISFVLIVVLFFGINAIAQLNRPGTDLIPPKSVEEPTTNETDTTSPAFEFGNNNDTIFDIKDSLNTEIEELPFIVRYESVKFRNDEYYDNYQKVDTNLLDFHNYIPYNKEKYQYVNLGTLGSPTYSLTPTFDRNSLNFNFGFNQFDLYKTNLSNLEIYDLNVPFTKFLWSIGPNNRQYFQAKHSNRIKDKVQLGLVLNKYTDLGYYYNGLTTIGTNPGTNHTDFSAYVDFANKYKDYKGTLIFNTSDLFYKQNGGTIIGVDSVFTGDNTSIFRRNAVEVNLDEAQSQEANLNFVYKHYYAFGKSRVLPTSDTSTIVQFIPKAKLQHQISYNKQVFSYLDIDTAQNLDFYPASTFQKNYNNDSTSIKYFNNKIDFISTGNDLSLDSIYTLPFKYNVGLQHQFVKFRNDFYTLETNLNNAFINADAYYDNLKIGKITAHFQLGILGEEKESYNLGASYLLDLKKYGALTFKANAKRYEPAYFKKFYSSNFYNWRNDFDKTTQEKITVNYLNKNLKINATASLSNYRKHVILENVANFNETSKILNPIATNFSIQRLHLDKNFDLGFWHFNNEFTWQNIVGNTLLDIPAIVYKGSYFYENQLFKRAIAIKLGIDLTYNSSFYTPEYDPVLGQFFYTKDHKFQTFPIVDVFLSFKVKTVNCFFKTEFANQGLFQKGYLTAFGYPHQDVAFRSGFSWNFYD